MGRYIYLVRHAKPFFPGGISLCLGSKSDPPLSDAGRADAERLAKCFPGMKEVYSSPLKRCLETAGIMGAKTTICIPELTEMNVGGWEGLSFSEIRSRYPGTYAERGLDWAVPPDDGESLSHGAERMQDILYFLTEKTDRDITAVTSDGVIRALLWKLLLLDSRKAPMIRQPYTGITVLKYENSCLKVTATGKTPEDFPPDGEIREIWELCKTPDAVRCHSEAVCEASMALYKELKKNGVSLSGNILRSGALLHDSCKTAGREHAYLAGALLRERGYLLTAGIVEAHDSGESGAPAAGDGIEEAEVLYLADKMICGTAPVSIEERFEMSRGKCRTDEARKMHRVRFERAISVRARLEKITGRKPEEIIKNEADQNGRSSWFGTVS